jgi:hypothetical protein
MIASLMGDINAWLALPVVANGQTESKGETVNQHRRPGISAQNADQWKQGLLSQGQRSMGEDSGSNAKTASTDGPM